jgi:hypothetical protein
MPYNAPCKNYFFHGILVTMMTIQQTVKIPVSRKVHFYVSLPEDAPCGWMDVLMDFKSADVQTGKHTTRRGYRHVNPIHQYRSCQSRKIPQ